MIDLQIKPENMEKSDTKASKRVFLIAQELEVIRMLSGNDEKAKNKALKSLNKWLLTRSKTMPFKEEDLQRIWKGLYYCMWMSDKPLVQEECADKISKLVHFPNISTSLLFFKAGLYMLSQEWSGIQQLRLDKFLMLVRRLLRETLIALKNNGYNKDSIESFNEILSDTVLNKANKTPIGLFMHFVEIFLEELAKVSRGKLQPSLVLDFIKPFIKCLALSNDGRQISHIRKFIFTYLIRQSKLGLEYQEKYEAWRQQGFPGHIDSMQKVKIEKNNDSSDEEIVLEKKTANRKEKPLDPRAGRVDVEIPQLNFKSNDIAKAILEYKFHANTSAQSRNMIKILAEQFASLARGVYPLGVKKLESNDKDDYINIRKAATSLIKYDQKISGKKTKKRKRDKENNSDEVVEKKRAKIQIESNLNSPNKKKLKTRKNDEVVVNGEGSKVNKIKNKNVLEEVKPIESVKENSDRKRKRKSEKSIDENKIKSNVIKAKNKLKNKDVQIITAVKKMKKNKERRGSNENIECIFKRNSGTWVVYDLENSENIVKSPKSSKLNKDDFTPAKSSKKQGKGDFEESKMSRLEHSSPNQSASNRFSESADDSPKLGMSPVKLFESPSSPDVKEIFKKSAWDEPLQEGEYEICIPSKRQVNKLKKQAKNQNKTVHELINTTLQKIKGKSRCSLDSRLVGNPFLKSDSNGSTKKVKINTKLNKSQEVYEHYSSVKSSPGIPFDANRRPAKPLLKPSAVSTPINPFYKKQLTF